MASVRDTNCEQTSVLLQWRPSKTRIPAMHSQQHGLADQLNRQPNDDTAPPASHQPTVSDMCDTALVPSTWRQAR